MSTINLGISPVVAGQGLVFSGATLNVNVANSIVITGDRLQLVGDQGSPGASYYYGTNALGVKGWYLNTGGGGAATAGVNYINGVSGTITIVGTGNVSVTTVGQTIYISGASGAGGGDVTTSQLYNTGSTLDNKINSLSGYSDANFATRAQLASTGQTAWTHGQNNALNLSGNLTATGARLMSLLTGASGALAAQIAVASAGVSSINGSSGAMILRGTGTVSITTNGQTITISGASGAAAVGQAQLSPSFVYTTGGVVNLSIDSTKATQNLHITATGNVIINASNTYDGANGAVIVYKTYAGTGSVTLPNGAVIANGLGATVMPLSTGASGYDFASFIYDQARSYWAISTLSGIANVSAGGGGGGTGTLVSVTGSSFLATANIIAIGSASAYISGGNTIVISGGAIGTGGGGAGDVTQAQLLSASGDLLNRPQSNLNGGTVLTGNTVYFDGFNANRTVTFAGASGPSAFITLRADVSGLYTLAFPSSYRIGEQGTTTGITLPPGNHEISWIRANNKWWLADSAGALSNLNATRGPISTDDQRSGYIAGSSYWFDQTVSGLYVNINATTSGAVWYRLNNPTGVFSSSIILNGQTLTTTGSNLYINGVLVSGGGGGSIASMVPTGVTGVNGITGAVTIVGAGTSVVTTSANTITVSGITREVLSPRFVYATGGVVNLTVDPAKSTQNLQITATGNVILNINGSYDGCAGSVLVYKTFGGTGSLTIPAGSHIINGLGASVIPLSTGASGYDAASFIYDLNRGYWAVSTLSGFASTSTLTLTGAYSVVTVTGSSIVSAPNFVAIGGGAVILSGNNTILISGGAGGGAGDVTQAQLNAVSGFFQTPPQIDLAGGTSLLVNTQYFDDFNADRALTFGGSPSAGSLITLRANITSNILLTIPTSYRIGQFGTVTTLYFTPGNHEISWLYADSKWWLGDSAGTTNDAVLRVTGNFTVTGGGQFRYVWSGAAGVTQTGTLASPSALSGYYINVKNITTGSNLLLSGNVDYTQNWTMTAKQAITLWSDNSSWLIV